MMSSRFPIFRRPRRPVDLRPRDPPDRLPGDNLLPVASLNNLELMAWLLLRM